MKKLFLTGALLCAFCLPALGLTDAERQIIQRLDALIAGGGVGGSSGTTKIDQTTPGSTNATQQKQYTGVPSTFTIGTSDGTVFTLAAGEIGFIQNLDDAALAVKKGASASTSSLSFILAAGTAADDGKGGAVEIKDWIGAVSVAALTGSPRFIAWKQAP